MKNRSTLRRALLLPMTLYGIGTALLLVLQWLLGERWKVISFLNTFSQLLWLPALFLLPLALMGRAWRTSLLLIPAALAWLFTYGDHLVPKAPPVVKPGQKTFTLMTYNLLDLPRDLRETVALVQQAQPDILAMQELNAETVDALNAALGDLYPYQAIHTDKGQFRGMGVMSKYPLSNDRYWDYEWMPVSLGHQRVTVEIDGHTLTLFNLHPVNPGVGGKRIYEHERRRREIAALTKEASTVSGPFVMNGDFNLPELSDEYHQITQEYGFVDAYRVRRQGLGHTFNLSLGIPFLRLDYMFLGDGVDVVDISVWPTSAGSDHHPVLATLVFK